MKGAKNAKDAREATLKAEIEGLEGDVQALEMRVEAYRETLENYQEVQVMLKNRVADLSGELEMSRATVRGLEGQNGNLKMVIGLLQNLVEDGQNEVRDLTSESRGFERAFELLAEKALDR